MVTGKLDVREVEAQLPSESEQPPLSDDIGAFIDGEKEPADGLGTLSEVAEA